MKLQKIKSAHIFEATHQIEEQGILKNYVSSL